MIKLYEYMSVFSNNQNIEQIREEALDRVVNHKEIKDWKGNLIVVPTNLGVSNIPNTSLYSIVIYGD